MSVYQAYRSPIRNVGLRWERSGMLRELLYLQELEAANADQDQEGEKQEEKPNGNNEQEQVQKIKNDKKVEGGENREKKGREKLDITTQEKKTKGRKVTGIVKKENQTKGSVHKVQNGRVIKQKAKPKQGALKTRNQN